MHFVLNEILNCNKQQGKKKKKNLKGLILKHYKYFKLNKFFDYLI